MAKQQPPARLDEVLRRGLTPTPPPAAGGAWLDVLRQHVVEQRERAPVYNMRRDFELAGDTLEFIERLMRAPGGIPVDNGRPMTFEGREFWRDIYRSMWGPKFVVCSSAQVGKSQMLFHGLHAVAHLWRYRGRGITHGLYLPTREFVLYFSKGRLTPILDAVGKLTGLAGNELRINEALREQCGISGDVPDDAYNFKAIAGQIILLAWLGGKMIDGAPLDILWLDEVRMMDPGDVDRVEARVYGSTIAWQGYTSTAGMPGDALSVRWDDSTQNRWFTTCGCAGGVDLAAAWPNCLGERKGEADPERRWYLFCPRCGKEPEDRGAGRWVPQNPDGRYPGFSPNQLITRQRVGIFADAWNRQDRNTAHFHNNVLGLEYLDREACPITQDILLQSVNEDLLWARPGDVNGTAMGIDQMGGVNYFVISQRPPNGKRRLVHLEILWGPDPFQRAAELMRAYDVRYCCLEALPNFNDAIRFANAFPGRVFLVIYTNTPNAPQIVWRDLTPEKDGEKPVKPEERTRFRVAVYKDNILDALASHWKEGRAEVPNHKGLTQIVEREGGGTFQTEICDQVYFDHLQRIARRQVEETKLADGIKRWNEKQRSPSGTKRAPVRGATTDPHFADADMLNWLAWTRLTSGSGGAALFWG